MCDSKQFFKIELPAQTKSKIQIIDQPISACGISSLIFIRAGHGIRGELSCVKILACLC